MNTISINDPKMVYQVLDGNKNQITLVTTMRDFKKEDIVKIYYRNTRKRNCRNCLNCEIVTGRKCPIYEQAGFIQIEKWGCTRFVNLIKEAKITNVTKYKSFEEIKSNEILLKKWTYAEGFNNVQDAINYLSQFLGISLMEESLTVFKWELIEPPRMDTTPQYLKVVP